jgi:hypothetical protein
MGIWTRRRAGRDLGGLIHDSDKGRAVHGRALHLGVNQRGLHDQIGLGSANRAQSATTGHNSAATTVAGVLASLHGSRGGMPRR